MALKPACVAQRLLTLALLLAILGWGGFRARRRLAAPDDRALRAAIEAGDAETVARLVDGGLDPDFSYHLARGLRPSLVCARLLLEAGADPEARDGQGRSALYYAQHAERLRPELGALLGRAPVASSR